MKTDSTNFNQQTDDFVDRQRLGGGRSAAASRSTSINVAVNIALSGLQISVGLLAKSQGLIADGIHSLSDLIADSVVLFASHHGGKEADPRLHIPPR